MRALANELAQHTIRVNTVHPTGVNTPMVVNDVMQQFLDRRTPPVAGAMANLLPVELVEPVDISNAVALAGLRRGPLRHRGHAAGRRRLPTK